MKIPFKKSFQENSEVLLRRCGYALQHDKKLNKFSFYRRLSTQHFPKFHVYVTSEKPLELDLHLDHKPHAYEGQRAHGGDYDSEIVRNEALRLWNMIHQEAVANKPVQDDNQSEEKKKGFFRSLWS